MKKSKPRQAGVSSSKNFSLMVKNTKQNKLRNIKKAIKVAGGAMIDKLNERLKFWEAR